MKFKWSELIYSGLIFLNLRTFVSSMAVYDIFKARYSFASACFIGFMFYLQVSRERELEDVRT